MSWSLDPDQTRHSGSNLFAKVIDRRQNLLQAGKDLNNGNTLVMDLVATDL